jgi:hypothetical protein
MNASPETHPMFLITMCDIFKTFSSILQTHIKTFLLVFVFFASSSDTPPQRIGGTSKPMGSEESTKDRYSPVEINLTVKITRITLQGANDSGIPPQGASSTSKPVEGEDLKHIAS